MRYRLKKELPFAKAGDEIHIGECIYTDDMEAWAIGERGDLKKLIEDGWIEEVKPREWWVGEQVLMNEDITNTNYDPPEGIKYIKVLEVIEGE